MTHKETFHYAAHPYEAYVKGYNVLIGDSHIQGEVYQAYTYFFPVEIITLYQALGDFYDVLIKDYKVPYINQRYKTFTDVFDIALNFLEKINKYHESNTSFLMGSKDKPVAHAYIGPVADYAIALNSYETMWEIIEEYTRKYHEKPLRSVPIICYHKQRNKEWLEQLLQPKTPETCKYTPNSILAGAVAFLYDTITNCGPETKEIYEIFTNDYRAREYDQVDLAILSKAKLAAFHTRQANRSIIQTEALLQEYRSYPSHPTYPTSTYVPPPPKFVKVRVVECYGDLNQGALAHSFVPTLEELKDMEEENKKALKKVQRMYQQMYGRDYDLRWQEDWD